MCGQDFVRDMWRGKLSLRAIWARIQNLPPNSSFANSVNDGWILRDHLLATIIDELRNANWQRAGGTDSNRPKPVERPGVVTKEDKHRAMLEAERARLKGGG